MGSQKSNDTFDIIIIGAGTAGSLLAARLSFNTSLRILVLEAGENRNDDATVRTPALSRRLMGNPSYDWQFQTSPEAGLNGRVIQQPRGKLWGGSSAINSHALVYPSTGYHNAWNTLLGDESANAEEFWNWEGVRKYYRRFQTLQKPSEDIRQELGIGTFGLEDAPKDTPEVEKGKEKEDGVEGIRASYPTTSHVLQKAWVDTINDLGYNNLKNPVDGGVIGGSITAAAIDSSKGERSHAGVVFLEPSTQNDNLFIRSGVLVEKILFDDDEREGKLVATGVLYSQENGQGQVIACASREVIVCAGTFGSPKVLELSGIGQRERLASVGVKCLRDLPGVGENLQDHLNFGPSVEVHDSIETYDVLAREPAKAEALRKLYEAKHIGLFAEGGAYCFSYMPLQILNSQDEERELATLVDKILQETSSTTSNGLKAQYEIIQRMINDPGEATATVFMTRKQRYTPPSEPAPGNYMTVIAMLSYPFSRGSSHIESANSKAHPQIKFNYLQHPLDAEILSRHTIQVGRVLKLPLLSEHLKPGGNTLPNGFSRQVEDVKEVEGYLRQFAATNYHPAGTCAMMSEGLGGVVDGSLKVYGTANVRVCDASVIPIIPRGNILSTVYALAEKGADIFERALKL